MSIMSIKEFLKSSVFYSLFDKTRKRYLYCRRRPYISQLQKRIHTNTSIISSNCFAGRIMQDLCMQYNSPTLGLYFFTPEYIKFLSNLEYYLTEAKLNFVEESRYELGNTRRKQWSHWYPIGMLSDESGGVEIEFLHYYSEEEAAEKWYRRSSRVNLEDVLVIGMEQNLCTVQHIQAFDNLPFKHKLFFSTRQINCASNIKIGEFTSNTEVGDPYKKGHVFYKYLADYFNKEEIVDEVSSRSII